MQGVVQGSRGSADHSHGPVAFPAPGSEAVAEHESWCEVPALSVRLMCGVLSDYGIDAEPLLREVRVPSDVLVVPARRIGWSQEVAFQRGFAELTMDQPQIWVETGRRYSYPVFDEIGLAMLVAPTLRHLQEISTTIDTFYSVGAYKVIDLDDGGTGLEMRMPPEVEPGSAHFLFSVYRDVATMAACLDDLWQSRFPFDRIELPLRSVPVELEGIAAGRMVPGADALRWIWSSDLSDVQLPRSNPMLYELFADRARTSDAWVPASLRLDDRVSDILSRPGNAGMSLQRVAAELAMSARTLQRRLDECQASFRDLQSAARLREACRLLPDTDLSIAEIAERLGYFEVASFSNAFRRWTGKSPSRFRREQGSTASTG